MTNKQNCSTFHEPSLEKCKLCSYNSNSDNYVFKTFIKDEGDELHKNISSSHIMILNHYGKVKLSYNDHKPVLLNALELVVIPQGVLLNIKALQPSKYTFIRFNTYDNICPYVNSGIYRKYLDESDHALYTLPLVSPLKDALKLFEQKLKRVDFNCKLYHKSKRMTFFSFLALYYSKEEIARLLYPVLSDDFFITELVHRYGSKVNKVSELVNMSGLSRTLFYNKFKEIYGVSAKQWLINTKAEKIKKALCEPGAIIKDIRYQFGFNSSSQFNRFCKNYLGDSPTNILRYYNTNKKTERQNQLNSTTN